MRAISEFISEDTFGLWRYPRRASVEVGTLLLHRKLLLSMYLDIEAFAS